MKATRVLVFLLVLCMCVALQACAPAPAPASTNAEQSDPVVPATDAPTPLEATQAVSLVPSEIAPTQTEPSAQPVVHYSFPGTPSYIDGQLIWECTMGYTYAVNQPVQLLRACDAWAINYLERPFRTDMSSYLPYLDIELAQFGAKDAWVYGRMRIFDAGMPSDGSSLFYLFEIDVDFDGRGEILVGVQDLPLGSRDWTTDGVRAWGDTNDDVGGDTPVRADTNPGDGYDTLLFDQGQGSDPDLVWARRSPNSDKWIEFAFKPALLNDDMTFSWIAWTFQGDFNPGEFDIVDNVPGAFQMDNTCSMEFNGSPVGFPNGCRAIQPPTPTPAPSCQKPPKPNLDPCWIWFQDKCQWICFN